jgi:ABC-type sulfate transport system permease subunit
MKRTSVNSIAPLATAAGACAMGVLALRYAIATPDEDALREFLVVTAMIAVATALVFGLVIPRALARGSSGGTALTLSLLGLLLAAAYWAGFPPVLAIGGIVLARRGDGRASLNRAAGAIGVLALVANLAVLAADAATS